MSKPSQYIIKDLLVALVTGVALASASCAVGYRVYDPEYGAYHNWDTIEENNRAVGTVLVRGRPQVLIADRDRSHAQSLASALRAQQLEVSLVEPSRIPTDIAGLKKYDDATTSLKKALDLDNTSKKPNPEIQAADNNALGEVYANTNKIPDATASYDAAAKLQPASAAMFYTNETIVLSRAGQTDATIAAADKAIAADPAKPIPYYLKGQALISKATVDPKTQKIVAPPGTADAYNKYLELAPTGPMAPEAKAILAEIGEKVSTKYNAKH